MSLRGAALAIEWETIMSKCSATILVACAILIPTITHAWEEEADVWDFPGDVLKTGNQISFDQEANGVWYFMQSHSLNHNPSIYRFLPEFHAPGIFAEGGADTPDGHSCWSISFSSGLLPDVCINFNFTPITLEGFDVPPRSSQMHPGEGKFSILAWKSPFSGDVCVHGALRDLDLHCGDGIIWSVDKGSKILRQGTLPNGGSTSFSIPSINLKKSDVLYFVIDPNGEISCDSTGLKVTISRSDANGGGC